MALQAGGDEETTRVGPGDHLVLVPPSANTLSTILNSCPPGDDDGDIESEDEGDRDELGKAMTVKRHLLKFLLEFTE
jgi:hypothetical protein